MNGKGLGFGKIIVKCMRNPTLGYQEERPKVLEEEALTETRLQRVICILLSIINVINHWNSESVVSILAKFNGVHAGAYRGQQPPPPPP